MAAIPADPGLPGVLSVRRTVVLGEGEEWAMASTSGSSSSGSPGQSRAKKRDVREITRIVVAVVGLILLISFVLGNSQPVTVSFLFFNAHISLIWVLLIAAVLGALVDRLVILLGERRKKAAKP